MHDGKSGGETEVWTFLILIVLVNAAFVWGIDNEVLPQRLYNLGRFLLLGLTLVAVVIAFRGTGGLLSLIRPMAVWRLSPGWYLFALLCAPALCILTLAGKAAITGEAFSPNFHIAGDPSKMRTVVIGSFVGEIVWVSYSLSRLSRRFTLFEASLIVGVFWTLWWTPIVLLGIGVIPGLPLVALLINMLGIAVMCGFVYAKTGSGLIVLILQIMVNSSILIFPVNPVDGGIPTYWAFSAVYAFAALVVAMAFGPKPLFRIGHGSRRTEDAA